MSEYNNISGLNELSKQLSRLGPEIGKRALRSAVNKAMTPTYKMVKMKAPVGSKAHWVKARKGAAPRLVGAGFLSRKGLKKSSRFFPRTGRAVAKIKIIPEAFYGAFYDVGVGKFPKSDWFTGTFISDRGKIEKIFVDVVKFYIKKFK